MFFVGGVPSPRYSGTVHLPHVTPFARTPIYFFTVCTHNRRQILACEPVSTALRDIWSVAAKHDGWAVGKYVIMPDHVHFFARSGVGATPRMRWLKMLKSVSSRRIIRAFAFEPPIWQADTFDHIVRSAVSYSEKWEYVRLNPVRKGLVAAAEAWPWQGEIEPLFF